MNKILKYCKDIDKWPSSWERGSADIEIGSRILNNIFIPFFEFLIGKNFTKKTIKKHIDNIWLLGGELIDQLDKEQELRKLNEFELVLKYIDNEGGPYSIHNITETETRSFDSSCKKLYKYIKSKV